MTDRSRYRLALTLTVVLACVTVSALWFVATFAGVLALLLVAVPMLPCLVFCVWRTWTSRRRLHSDLTGAAQEARQVGP
jgi:hypothetical protein